MADRLGRCHPGPQELVYEIRVGNQTVGTHEVKVRMEDIEGAEGVIESFTDIGGQVGPVLFFTSSA